MVSDLHMFSDVDVSALQVSDAVLSFEFLFGCFGLLQLKFTYAKNVPEILRSSSAQNCVECRLPGFWINLHPLHYYGILLHGPVFTVF